MNNEPFRLWVLIPGRSETIGVQYDRPVPLPNIGDWCEDPESDGRYVVREREFSYVEGVVFVTLYLDRPAE